MTGRERLNAIMHRQPADRLAWTTLVDSATLNALPEPLGRQDSLAFYRHLGCDIFLLNGWGLPHGFISPELRWGKEVQFIARREDGNHVYEWRTARGVLTGICHANGHPLKYPVDSIEAVRLYREMWENARFVEADDRPAYTALNRLVGADGIVTRFWGPSTIPRLLETDMGTMNFYYLLNDHPREMMELIRVIHERELQAFAILGRGPCDVVILCENTSTYYISPDVYRRFNGPHVKDFVDATHAAGKVALVHMCGHVFNLLPDIKQTGLDGIHALTPPPTGNTPWETALDVLGDDLIIIGALDPTIFIMKPLAQIGEALDALYTPRLRRSNFVLGPFADGIAVPLERFQAVSRWMERQ
jgi:hypothetical protein